MDSLASNSNASGVEGVENTSDETLRSVRPLIPELPFLNEKDHPETLSIATPYIRSYHNAITSKGINVAGSIGMFDGSFRELFFVLSHFEERIKDLEEVFFKQQKKILELEKLLGEDETE